GNLNLKYVLFLLPYFTSKIAIDEQTYPLFNYDLWRSVLLKRDAPPSFVIAPSITGKGSQRCPCFLGYQLKQYQF
ncbi:hypothetical protein L4D00_03395, partial [Photobacterium swingsii]|uniref:hypothetical protein n=1 Tax=Photobacterium swingsii TaxID=680026 RepID=UPI003D0B09BE